VATLLLIMMNALKSCENRFWKSWKSTSRYQKNRDRANQSSACWNLH